MNERCFETALRAGLARNLQERPRQQGALHERREQPARSRDQPYFAAAPAQSVHWPGLAAETLALAKRSGRPVLLSVGYAACHWCHVMAHESFENAGIAALMNEYFVNVKVDAKSDQTSTICINKRDDDGRRGGCP